MKVTTIYSLMLILFAACSGEENHGHLGHQQSPATTSSTENREQDLSIMLTDTQMKLGNITSRPISRQHVGQTIPISARLVADEQNSEVISSRATGRIEKLFIKETGRGVRKGQPLYTLYSETLLTLQQEYLLAREQYEALGATQKRYKSFFEAAKRKLLLYGLTSGQIEQLHDRTSLQPRITFLAPDAGIVTEINVSEGQYVAEGASLYKLEDISALWVEAELYPDETELVKVGDKVSVRIDGANTSALEARVTFLSPEFRNNTQITVMRAEIDNPGNRFKPGQHAQVFLTHSGKEAIAIPTDAVIRDEHGSHVYVQAGRNTFRPQVVQTGVESFELVEITAGLHENDTVAVTGAYLLYSEMILKNGTDPMAGHVGH